jgi:hypothetical protein
MRDIAEYLASVKETKTQVKKHLAQGKPWRGYICGNNVNPYHVASLSHCGDYIKVATIEEFEEVLSNFLYYLEPELGRYASYYHTDKWV